MFSCIHVQGLFLAYYLQKKKDLHAIKKSIIFTLQQMEVAMEDNKKEDPVLMLVSSPFFRGASFKKTPQGVKGSILLKNGIRSKEVIVR